MQIPLPKDEYLTKVELGDGVIDIQTAKRKKIALLFISINQIYWPYLKQVIEDCRKNFMVQHHVDYHVWSDMPETELAGVKFHPTEPVEWPAPTLMRYHLFLQEESLKDYDYIFYLDADMRVVERISDEILCDGLTVAPHPGYYVHEKLIPPLEPNPRSTAYIPRLGEIRNGVDGRDRFFPFYAAGGLQGGNATRFIEAMRVMKAHIDADFDKNYTAIWNDETHWNSYLWNYQAAGGKILFLDPSYVYPDSLIKEYYVPKIWGRDFTPKIITLTKPHTLSKQAGAELNAFMGKPVNGMQCPTCKDWLEYPGHKIIRILGCSGSRKPHETEMHKL